MSHKNYRQEKDCLNCGSVVEQKFCPQCGQENLEYRDNFFHMSVEVIGDFFHFDSKFFRSIKPLFTNPGFLTSEYQAGKRASYIQPIRLFFFSTIVMVIVAGVYYKKFEKVIIDEKLTITSDSTQVVSSKGDKITKQDTIVIQKSTKVSEMNPDEFTQEQKGMVRGMNVGFESMSHNLKYISFFMLPLYALIFMMLYRKHKSYYVDHLIYVLHVQSFAYIVLTFLMLIPVFITSSARDWFAKVLLAIVILYIGKSLHYIYKESWGKTILKTILSSAIIVFVTQLMIACYIFTVYLIEK